MDDDARTRVAINRLNYSSPVTGSRSRTMQLFQLMQSMGYSNNMIKNASEGIKATQTSWPSHISTTHFSAIASLKKQNCKMKLSLGVVAIICSFLISDIRTENAACKEIVTKLLKTQLKQITTCITTLGYTKAEDRIDKMSCVLKCVLQQAGFIAGDGSADPAATLAFIERHLPESDRERATVTIMDCQEAAANLKPDEPTCKSYDVLIKCAMAAMNKFCA